MDIPDNIYESLKKCVELAERGALDPLTAAMGVAVVKYVEYNNAQKEIAKLKAEKEALEKQADWLAMELEKREHGCKWCEEYQKPCIPDFVSCGYKGPDNWRKAVRIAVEVK